MRRRQVFWVSFFLLGSATTAAAHLQEAGDVAVNVADQQSATVSSPQATLAPQDPPTKTPVDGKDDGSNKTGSAIESPKPKVETDETPPPQTKRILWIIPNYRAVSTMTHLPPLTVKEKFWLATQDSFDYSSFIFTGMLAGIAMANVSEPSFGQGAAGYGIYYAHAFADGTIENYMTEAIVPTLTKQDPRYYTLGQGGFFKRTAYSFSRLFITRTNGGRNTFNFSEIVGAGAAAGIGNVYYPSHSNEWVKTYQRWGTQLALDGAGDVLKEFWPEINRAIFHNKY